ncbi:MAG: hypothetical protein LBU69_05305 [Deltaproteobacteria bacterium]|jgi:Spy/CpxP family protein refolding chaperone|nr:hypothetical protein [Deltaproteobacteria bacterium]
MPALKKLLLVALSLSIVALAGLALAQGDPVPPPASGSGGNYAPDGDQGWGGRNNRGLTEEQRQALDQLQAEHVAKVQPLMDQFYENRLRYRALANNQNAPIDEINKTINELSRIKKELRDARASFRQSLRDKGLPASGLRRPGPDDSDWGDDGYPGRFPRPSQGGRQAYCDGPGDSSWGDGHYPGRGHRGGRHGYYGGPGVGPWDDDGYWDGGQRRGHGRR